MLVIPAIDIKGGRCVRLLQGDPDKETVYAENPALMAQQFEKMGAKLIHVVDLDGAFNGKPVNKDIVAKISESVSIPIEIGGGIRSIETIEDYLSLGIKRIIIGTSALSEDFKVFIRKYPDNIIAGIDARDSMVATHGWKTSSDKIAMDLIKELQNFGIKEIIYTDIKTDGMLTGPNYNSIGSGHNPVDRTIRCGTFPDRKNAGGRLRSRHRDHHAGTLPVCRWDCRFPPRRGGGAYPQSCCVPDRV